MLNVTVIVVVVLVRRFSNNPLLRVQNLIQAGAEGILGEECFMKCLEVNDRLVAVLSDEGEKKKGGLKDDTDEGILNVEEEVRRTIIIIINNYIREDTFQF